jgi:hypothetical protein
MNNYIYLSLNKFNLEVEKRKIVPPGADPCIVDWGLKPPEVNTIYSS